MVASLTVIANDESSATKIEFTAEEVEALDMPGISLGHLVIFRDKMEKLFKLEPLPFRYKDGFLDRIYEVHYVAKLIIKSLEVTDNEGELGKGPIQKELWSWIWHILKDETKEDTFVFDVNAGVIDIV